MRKHLQSFPVLMAASLMMAVPMVAQSTADANTSTTSQQTTTTTTTQKTSQSREGFWGKVNPFARKKWVARQVDPIREREDELDVVTARNSNDIKDLDARTSAGIRRASDAASAADSRAGQAQDQARNAQGTADSARSQAAALQGTVNGLDNYSAESTTKVKFAPGSAVLGPAARKTLDEMADKVASDKGYIIQVEGHATARGAAGTALSEKMADSVTRYLVTKHNVPLYRISRIGYGSARPAGTKSTGSVVEITLLHNSLAASSGSPIGATQPLHSTSPATAASASTAEQNRP